MLPHTPTIQETLARNAIAVRYDYDPKTDTVTETYPDGRIILYTPDDDLRDMMLSLIED